MAIYFFTGTNATVTNSYGVTRFSGQAPNWNIQTDGSGVGNPGYDTVLLFASADISCDTPDTPISIGIYHNTTIISVFPVLNGTDTTSTLSGSTHNITMNSGQILPISFSQLVTGLHSYDAEGNNVNTWFDFGISTPNSTSATVTLSNLSISLLDINYIPYM